MKIGIGIDTGGTYTDIIAYDYDSGVVLSKSKTRTTKEDLTVCITRAIESVPMELLEQGEVLCLSTTLATNACVENKGIHSKLIIVGIPQNVLTRVDAKRKYGLDPNDVLCFDANGSFDGSRVEEPDWEEIYRENIDWFADAQALCISEVNALRNSAIVERHGRDFFQTVLDIPISLATDLAHELNVLERGATALLNSRLVPLIADFIDAVHASLAKLGLEMPVMIVRSDGSLMNTEVARENPVQTILSGPASSVMGGKALNDDENCLIIDIGGTTTDISIVEGGFPAVTDSIQIGGWTTQVHGVFIDTFGLGGDSVVRFNGNQMVLGTRRVVPLCVAAETYPQIIPGLESLMAWRKRSVFPDHEFLFIAREPESLDGFTDHEKHLLDLLAKGPALFGGGVLPIYDLRSDRLEDQGIIMRCGMTPTDAMHLSGDFQQFNVEASRLAAMHFAYNVYNLGISEDRSQYVDQVWKDIYRAVERRLYECIANALLSYRYPSAITAESKKFFDKIIADYWEKCICGDSKAIADAMLNIKGSLVGIGAPTHVFLPTVAKYLDVECCIPNDHEVANAVGCAIADIAARVEVEIMPNLTDAVEGIYRIETPDGARGFESIEEAEEFAQEFAEQRAREEAKLRGAIGELDVKASVKRHEFTDVYGVTLNMDSKVEAIASGRII